LRHPSGCGEESRSEIAVATFACTRRHLIGKTLLYLLIQINGNSFGGVPLRIDPAEAKVPAATSYLTVIVIFSETTGGLNE
jgi:hypothetical protein